MILSLTVLFVGCNNDKPSEEECIQMIQKVVPRLGSDSDIFKLNIEKDELTEDGLKYRFDGSLIEKKTNDSLRLSAEFEKQDGKWILTDID